MFIKVLGKANEEIYINLNCVSYIAKSLGGEYTYEFGIVDHEGKITPIYVNDSKEKEIAKFLKVWRLEGK